jgi:hypothetical protein
MKSLAICLLLFASPAFAESFEELIDRAFERLDDDLSGHWSYTHTQDSGEGIYVGRYDPRLPESNRWTLISVDGREPTADETEDYRDEQAEKHDQESDDEDNSFASIATKGSVALIEETDGYWLFSFEPSPDSEDEREFMESIHGTLKVIKEGHYVALITLQNRNTIKPGKGIKIREFLTRLEFAPVQDDGPVLPHSVQATVKGKAFFVIRIDESETVKYSDFERVKE